MIRQAFLFTAMLTVIITAGGIGKRLGSDIPKQFLVLKDKPVLMHTLEAFHQYDAQTELLLTLPADWLDYWRELCEKYDFTLKHQVITGGAERFHSIKNALEYAGGEQIAVHDGVRPLIDSQTIDRVVQAARKSGAAIPVMAVKESLRNVRNGQSRAVTRSEYVSVQTPQVFEAKLLKKAYELVYHQGITDDASLVELLGMEITLVEGSERNFKITTLEDLILADFLIKRN